MLLLFQESVENDECKKVKIDYVLETDLKGKHKCFKRRRPDYKKEMCRGNMLYSNSCYKRSFQK